MTTIVTKLAIVVAPPVRFLTTPIMMPPVPKQRLAKNVAKQTARL